MADFPEWEDVAASNPLVITIRGNKYKVPALGYLDAIKVREEFAAVKAGAAPQMSNDDFVHLMLSEPIVKQMRADNVPQDAIVHAAIVAQTDSQLGREEALDMWVNGPDPEALAAVMKAIAAAAAGSTTSPSTDEAASSTPTPASTSGTRSPKAPAKKSPGTKSSATRRSSPPTS